MVALALLVLYLLKQLTPQNFTSASDDFDCSKNDGWNAVSAYSGEILTLHHIAAELSAGIRWIHHQMKQTEKKPKKKHFKSLCVNI